MRMEPNHNECPHSTGGAAGTHWLRTCQLPHHHIKLKIIQCCAPTNDADNEKERLFLPATRVSDSQRRSQGHNHSDHFYAKISSDSIGYEATTGTYGLGQMNDNGERFADLCVVNQPVIRGSIFTTQAYPQGHMKIPGPRHGEPDRPHLH